MDVDEKRVPVQPVLIKKLCKTCGVDLVYEGYIVALKQHLHKCPKCKESIAYNKVYPAIEVLTVD